MHDGKEQKRLQCIHKRGRRKELQAPGGTPSSVAAALSFAECAAGYV